MSTEKLHKNTPFREIYRSAVLKLSIPEARAEWHVKCGWVSADKAMNIMFSSQRRAIFLLEVLPFE